MSFHTITMMVLWAMNAQDQDLDLIETLRAVPKHQRKNDTRLIQLVQRLKEEWSNGKKIERLATLGWVESESINLFSDLLDNIPSLRVEYNRQLPGKLPIILEDDDIDKYEAAIENERQKLRN